MNEGILDIADFREITGLELDGDEDLANYNRANSRATRYLERILGWSFTYKSTHEEAAKSKINGTCPTEEQYEAWVDEPEENDFFLEPDTENGNTKLLPFYYEDSMYKIDPATSIYTLKLVKLLSKDEAKFITVYEFAPDDWNTHVKMNMISGRTPLINWIEICKGPQTYPCDCSENKSCYMLAVDADWCKRLPEDLMYLMSDLILYYMKHPVSLTSAEAEYAVSSESVDGHSVSYNTNLKNPLSTLEGIIETNHDIIANYVGPFSPLYTKMRVL